MELVFIDINAMDLLETRLGFATGPALVPLGRLDATAALPCKYTR